MSPAGTFLELLERLDCDVLRDVEPLMHVAPADGATIENAGANQELEFVDRHEPARRLGVDVCLQLRDERDRGVVVEEGVAVVVDELVGEDGAAFALVDLGVEADSASAAAEVFDEAGVVGHGDVYQFDVGASS